MKLSFSFILSAIFLSLSTTIEAQFQTSSPITDRATSTVQTPATSSTSISSPSACNNSPLLCSRAYNNITHFGAHDAAFLRDSTTKFSISGNQFYNATVALSAGVRLLQAQVHNLSGVLQLCHSSCNLLNGGTLAAWLTDIKAWMDSNPNEVVTLLLVNSDNDPAASYGSVFSSSGLSTYGYTPPSTSGPIITWPTLQAMIAANTRLVTFIASIDYSAASPYLLPQYTYTFETAYQITSFSQFVCTVDRPSTLSAASAIDSGYLPLMNHFKYSNQAFGIQTPDIGNITITNSPNTTTTGALGLHAQNCRNTWGIKPTFIFVDFWNVGPAIAVADAMNGITPQGRKFVSSGLLTQTSAAVALTEPSLAVALVALFVVAGLNLLVL